MSAPPPQSTGPLVGVRIVEIDAIGPVPLACAILAGLGADIVRVARKGGGTWGEVGGAVLHRGRTRIELDLKDAADRDALLDLVDRADALIEGFRPGVMERLGIGPGACLERNPRLVFARVTGWGQDGPLADRAGHDINYIALTGALHAIGEKDAPPTVPLNIIGDYAGGSMFAALGLVAAILSARTSGRGQVVDVAMVDGVASLLGLFHAFLGNGLWRDERGANLLDGAAPFYRCYACADGNHVAVGALEPQFFAALLDGLGVSPDRFVQHDRDDWPAMERAFSAAFATRSRDEWEARFAGTDACVTPVLSLGEAYGHPANVARDVFVATGGILHGAPAPRFSATPGQGGEARAMSVAEAIAAWAR
jgi:alpha-methylacyl-CoA racemase